MRETEQGNGDSEMDATREQGFITGVVMTPEVLHNVTMDINGAGGVKIGLHRHSWEDFRSVAENVGIAVERLDVDDYDDGLVVVSFARIGPWDSGVCLSWFTDRETVESIDVLAELL